MEAFINGMACISHHNTISEDYFFEEELKPPVSNVLSVTAPDYKNFIPAANIRRTSQILKMGISAGLISLTRAGIKKPDAIVVGTAMGCFEDTDKFLRSIGDNQEKMLTPTAFIQSTHNTVAGQLALITNCQGYNFTYVHQNVSFESALLDALMLLSEKEHEHILLGGIDEFNSSLQELFERAGHLKKEEDLSTPLWNSTSSGFVAGQGAAFFCLSLKNTGNSIARIRGLKIIQKINNSADLENEYVQFLSENKLQKNEVSLVLSGLSGDQTTDRPLKSFQESQNLPVAYFKTLCGEYFTSSGFAVWLAAKIIQKQKVPTGITANQQIAQKIDNIIIVNQYLNGQYSFIFVSKC